MVRRRRSRSKSLGDSPSGHANKALSLENAAMSTFRNSMRSGISCKAAFALYTNGAITMGEAAAHHLEADRRPASKRMELDQLAEAAYGKLRGCLRDGSLSGLSGKHRRRRSR